MKQKGTILIVDDDSISREILKEFLSDEFEVVEAEDGLEALDLLISQNVEVSAIITDLIMPRVDGDKFIKLITKVNHFENVPIIISSSNQDLESEVKCLKSGAWDYIKKPYYRDIVRFRVRNAVSRSQKSVMNNFKHRFEYDELTGIYRRDKFFEVARRLIDESEETYAFCRVDIDKFKMYNSYFGYHEGNNLLCFLVNRIRMLIFNFETIECGRIVDDVFCFMVPYDKEKIIKAINDINTSLRNYNKNYEIVPSFGICPITNKEVSIREVFDMATLAAQDVKGHYTEIYSFYNDEMRETLIEEQTIINEMANALENEQFAVYLQPKYDLNTEKPIGSEALVRWIHPTKGIISPGLFIPIFERNGFIAKLDFYMWENICKIIRRWLDEGKEVLPISVNISRISMFNGLVSNIIVDLLKRYDIDPKHFKVELTESAYTTNFDVVHNSLLKMQEAGIKVLMDDFGSGYSSLNSLKDMNIDELKIDMRFLSRNNEDRGDIILQAVVKMAHRLEMPVIAEGVETKEQASFLNSLGCESAQGYFYAKPMPVSEYEKLVYQNK